MNSQKRYILEAPHSTNTFASLIARTSLKICETVSSCSLISTAFKKITNSAWQFFSCSFFLCGNDGGRSSK